MVLFEWATRAPRSRVRRAEAGKGMFKGLLNSIVIVPVLLGVLAATTSRRERTGLLLLLASLIVYDVVFVLTLLYLRRRWVWFA